MADRKIDYNRGVMINSHRSGVDVYMYVDEPGVYLNAFAAEVSEQFAKEAGFDVETYGKARRKREMMAQAMQLIEDELADDNDPKVIEDRDGFKLVQLGLDRYVVEDPDGQRLTPTPLGNLLARKVLDGLKPKVKEAKEPAKEAKGNAAPVNPNKEAKGQPFDPKAPVQGGADKPTNNQA